jgi:large subunit ribosomal protein L22
VKLRADELKRRAEEAGVSLAQLAGAVERPGLKGKAAESAVRNWISGRDHPRCKKTDIERLADVVGCEAKDISRFVSQVCHHRGSPRKAKLVVDLIRGRSADEAEELLRFSPKRAAVNVRKALEAARADAQENGADSTALVVAESRVDQAPHIKRFRPKDRGRAHPILKRTSHITVGLQERSSAGF